MPSKVGMTGEGICLLITPGYIAGWPEWAWPLQVHEDLKYTVP